MNKPYWNINKQLLVSSYDDYFVDADNNFLRYRHKEGRGELTIKRKLAEHNNNKRIEVNLPTEGNAFEAVSQFSELLGYKHNFCIYKTCKVYWLDNHIVAVYYVVYDNEWKELKRFIEIEADEDHPWESEEEAWNAVELCEAHLEELGIKSKNRLKRSLFEMFRKP